MSIYINLKTLNASLNVNEKTFELNMSEFQAFCVHHILFNNKKKLRHKPSDIEQAE